MSSLLGVRQLGNAAGGVKIHLYQSVMQSEVSQKEKNKYRMLTHIYGI